ncbi:MAG: YncE family protein [Gemmataceae bacterium]
MTSAKRIALPLGLALCVAVARAADPATLELVQTIDWTGAVGRLDHMALDAKGNRLFVANLSNDTLDVIDLKAGRVVKQIPGQTKVEGVAYAADLDRVFVGVGGAGVCNCFDGKTLELLHSVKLPEADNVRYHPGTRRVYVGHADKSISAIDAQTGTVLATVALPGPVEAFQLDPTKPRLYVNVLSPSRVVVVDTETNAIREQFSLTKAAANYPLALDGSGNRLFAGCRKGPMVEVLDLATGKELATVAIPGDVDDLFFDAKRQRLYATCGEGFIAVIAAKGGDNYEVVETVATAKLARTGLFDAEGGRLFVVLPRQATTAGPSLRVYRPQPR